nr:HAD domain-containing protein [Micromonospora sp. DSM 115978]
MPTAADRPLIFLDVDGPLIPFRPREAEHRRTATTTDAHPLLHRLDPADGRRLLALGCELVWATTWLADANEVISPRLGLPELPVVTWPDETDDPPAGLHWKTMLLVAWAAGRPFVWLDDEITDRDRWWVDEAHRGRALLHRVDPDTGLTETDFAVLHRWLSG